MKIYALMFIVCMISTLLWSTPCMKKDKWKQIHNICYWILLILYLDIGCLVSVTSLTAEFWAVFLLPSLLKEAHKFSIDIFDCDNDTVSIYIHCITSVLTILLQHGYSTNNVRNKSWMIYYSYHLLFIEISSLVKLKNELKRYIISYLVLKKLLVSMSFFENFSSKEI